MTAVPTQTCLELGKNNLRVVDLDQVDIRHALTTFLARRALLLELDLAVQAQQLDIPQRLRDGFRFGLARLFDRSRNGADAVVTTETFRCTGEIEATLLPFAEEIFGCFRISASHPDTRARRS